MNDAKNKLTAEVNKFLQEQKSTQADLENYRAFQKLGLDIKINGKCIIDNLKLKVTSCGKNVTVLGVEDISGLQIGFHYRISDGINSEVVQVVGLGYGSASDYAYISEPLKNAYDLSSVKLYRTNKSLGQHSRIEIEGEEFAGIEAGTTREIYVELK